MSSNCNHATCQGEFCRREQPPQKTYAPLKRTAIKKKPYKPKENASELNAFFSVMIEKLPHVCINCGALERYSMDEFLLRSCIAHLLEKRHFKSLATLELNAMFLGSGLSGICHCHDDYDSSWSKASTMKIWPEVVRRFKIMYPLILPEEHQFIPDALLAEL